MRRFFAFALLAILSCRHDNDEGFTAATSASGTAPVAVAGDDQKVVLGATVTLDGSKSSGGTLTYLWEQTGGTAVTNFVGATTATPSFTAPAAEGALTFRLTVADANGTDSDTVTVTVKTVVVTAPGDAWFVGYDVSGTLSANASGGTGPYTYEWTGLNSWFTWTPGSPDVNYTTPLLTDFQYLPADRRAVLALESRAQGRLRLKVKVTDTPSGATDEKIVNFSAGPLAATTMGENVALGEPVFLYASETRPFFSWTGTRPDGTPITFFTQKKAAQNDQRIVYFMPDIPGPYKVVVAESDGAGWSRTTVFNLVGAEYVGAGNVLGGVPDTYKGQCAGCHRGYLSWLPDLVTPWEQTRHATAYSRLLDPADTHYAASQATGRWQDAFDFGSDFSIDARTTGFSRISVASNGGWALHAASEDYGLVGTSWDDMKRKFPGTAELSNVQCEACHGPGSLHLGDSRGIRKTGDASLCGRCHDAEYIQWAMDPGGDGHGRVGLGNRAGQDQCNGCHEAQGCIVEIKALEGSNPFPVPMWGTNPKRIPLPDYLRRGQTCQTCHDPHRLTPNRPAGGSDPQLRVYGRVRFRSGTIVDAKESAICMVCHQSQIDTRDGSWQTEARYGPHYQTQAEMLAGTGGMHFAGWTYNGSAHGKPDRFGNRWCLACHFDAQPAAGTMGSDSLAGHTFRTEFGGQILAASTWGYTGAETVPGTKIFRVASGFSWLERVSIGDAITIDGTSYPVASLDSSRQLTVVAASNFATSTVTTWEILATPRYHTAACTQCHASIAADFRETAGADYDGDLTIDPVQDEIAGLKTKLYNAINTSLATLGGEAFNGNDWSRANRITYVETASGKRYTFPGPGVPNVELQKPWSAWTSDEQALWTTLYKAAYNYYFVKYDYSGGIHNTGYAVNLLQSSYFAITGLSAGDPYIP